MYLEKEINGYVIIIIFVIYRLDFLFYFLQKKKKKTADT